MSTIRKRSRRLLFEWGKFIGAGGGELNWKIECNALTDDDWQCIANVAAPKLGNFSSIHGVPTGGFPLERALRLFITPDGPPLIVDDVWTTGKSLSYFAKGGQGWHSFVLFARGELPRNVTAFFKTCL